MRGWIYIVKTILALWALLYYNLINNIGYVTNVSNKRRGESYAA